MKSLELLNSFYTVGNGEKQIRFHSDFSKESLRLLKFLVSSKFIEPLKLKGKRAYAPIFTAQEFEKFHVIPLKETRTISMVVKNEKKIQTIIFDGKLRDWVAIGWIESKQADPDDFKKYPVAMI